jgi:hypothetical protein
MANTKILPVDLTREFPKNAGEAPDVASLAAFCESVSSEARAIWTEMDELRYRGHTIEVPSGLEADIVRTPLANANVTRATATLMDQGLKISIPHNQEEYEGAGRDDRLETLIRAVLEQMRRQKGQDVDSKYVEAVGHYGQGGMKLVYAPQLWRDRPKRERSESDEAYNDRVDEWIRKQRRLPFNWSWVSPLEATPIWREDRLVAILQQSERSADTIYWQGFNGRPTQEWIDSVSRDANSGASKNLTVQEYWTEETVTYAIDGQVVSHQKHHYGRVPYTWSYGISPATRDPKYQGQPILWDMSEILKSLDRLLTQKNSAIRQWAWPTIMVTPGQYSVDQSTGSWTHQIEIEPGGIVQKLPGEVLEFLMWPSAGPDIDRQIALYLQLLQTVGISDPAMGVGDGQSGYAMSQLIQATRMKFGPIQQHCEAGFEDLITLLLDIVEDVMPHPVYLYPHGDKHLLRLSPKEIGGQRQIQVRLTPTLPTDKYANSSRIIAEYNSGLISRRAAMEGLGIDDPQAMEMEIIWDQMKARPPIQQVMEKMALEGMNMQLQEEQPEQPLTQEQAMQQLMAEAQNNPALLQALMAGQMGGPPGAPPGLEHLQAPTPGAGIMAAPGVPVIPPTPQPSAGQMRGMAGGLNPRPQGIGPGQAPGVRRGPVEER